MAAHRDIQSFVTKYFELLHSGKDAKLSLTCKAGKASAQLHLDVVLHLSRPQRDRERPARQPGPSRLRRRHRRAEERAKATDVVIAEQATSPFQTKPLAAAQAVDNTLIEVEATEEVSEENDTKTKEDTAVEAAIPEKNDKETWEAPDESITNSGGIHAFRSSTPQKPNVQGLSRSYRQNCDQCFHNSVCVD